MKPLHTIAQQQSGLLRTIQGDDYSTAYDAHGIAVYQRNLQASATRALSISYPTVQALIGSEAFALLTRRFLRDNPLRSADWGRWGEAFPTWLSTVDEVAEYPYIADCALLDWACHQCNRATDVFADLDSLQSVAGCDPYELHILYAAGLQLLTSDFPIVDIWQAHQSEEDTQRDFMRAQSKLMAGIGQTALVWRQQWCTLVRAITDDEVIWLRYHNSAYSLGNLLDGLALHDMPLNQWLPMAMQQGIVVGLQVIPIKTQEGAL